MFKLIAQSSETYTYLTTIERRPYVITVSSSGKLLDVKPSDNSKGIESSSLKRNIEFG